MSARDAVITSCLDALPALLEDLVARTGDRAVAADVAAEAFAAVLAADDPARSLAATADDVLARAQRRGEVPDAARRRMGMPPLDLSEAALARAPGAARGRPAGPAAAARGGRARRATTSSPTWRRRPAPRGPAPGGARCRGSRRRPGSLVAGAVAAVALAGGGDPAAPAAHAGDCPQRFSARLARQVPALDAARVIPLPATARAVIDQRSWPVERVQDGQAQLLSAEGDLRFWAVPVVSHGGRCAPADGACVIAAADGGDADAHCAWGDPLPTHRVARVAGQQVVLGIADPDVSAIRARLGGEWTGVPALGGIVATRVPQLPGFGGISEYQPQILPRVAVVDATGGDHDLVAGLLDDLRDWGYPTSARVVRGDPALAPPEIRWRAGLTDRASAERLARHVGTTAVRRVADDHTGGAPLILVAGTG